MGDEGDCFIGVMRYFVDSVGSALDRAVQLEETFKQRSDITQYGIDR
jgi:hypothetical protein